MVLLLAQRGQLESKFRQAGLSGLHLFITECNDFWVNKGQGRFNLGRSLGGLTKQRRGRGIRRITIAP